MLFVIDVGNTNVVLGFFDGAELKASYRMATDKNRSSDEIGMFFLHIFSDSGILRNEIEDVIISSVVPPIMHSLENAVKRYIGKRAHIITAETPLGINIRIDNPKELGADRIVNAFAACELYGAPAVIIDFGTATTFCAVDAARNYLGGVIYPGLKISLEALVEKTAKLPRVEIVRPDEVIGKNTVNCMQSGLVYGYAGMVDAVSRRIKKQLGAPDAQVIATGGLSKLISGESEEIGVVDRNLTLNGLRLIYDMLYR